MRYGHGTTEPYTNKLSDENWHVQISDRRRKRAYVTVMLACNFLATLFARVRLVRSSMLVGVGDGGYAHWDGHIGCSGNAHRNFMPHFGYHDRRGYAA